MAGLAALENNRLGKTKEVICDNCGKPFQCQLWRIEKRKNIFCSKKCEGEYRKAQTPLNCVCEICGKKFHAKPCHINKGFGKFCSKECMAKDKEESMKGENNHQYGLKGNLNASWISDEKISYYGYKLIRCLDHPFKNSDDMVFEHRLIAEEYLLNDENSIEYNGEKYLSPKYTVHHIDFNRLHNEKNNLQVMPRCEHMSMHHKLKDDENLFQYCIQHNLDIEEVKKYRGSYPTYKSK